VFSGSLKHDRDEIVTVFVVVGEVLDVVLKE
jgi:hypothetical protein